MHWAASFSDAPIVIVRRSNRWGWNSEQGGDMRGGEKCLSSRRVGKREGSKLVEAVEAGGECKLL